MSYNPQNPNGQSTMANSEPVVLASDHSDVKITLDGESVAISGTVTTTATNLDIRDLVAASDAISIHGSVGIIDQLDLTSSNPAVVAIVDANGDQITSFGGGTQYTEGDTDATITGTALLMEGAADTLLPVQGTVADGLLVNLGSNNDVTVTGTVTANLAAGTNNIGDIDVLTVPSDPFGLNADASSATGSISAKLRYIAATNLQTTNFTNVFDTNNVTLSLNTDGIAEARSGLISAAPVYGFNGSSFDRIRGTIADGLLVNLGSNNDVTVTGTVAVTDNAGSLTVDAPVGTPVFVRLSDGASAISTLPVSLASVPSHAVTNAGTFAVQVDGNALTALQLIDDPVFADNAGFTDNSSKVSVSGYYFDEVAGTALTENDVAAARIDSKRAQVHVIEDATTRGLRAGVVDETGTNAVDAIAVGGGTPHDSVNSGNPLLNGFEAIAHGTNPTAVAAADRTKAYANRAGIPFVMGGHPNIQSAEYFTSGAVTDDNILPAIAGGTKYVITSISVTCSAANATSPSVRIGFGTASVPAQGATNADAVTKVVLSHPGIPAGSGIVKGNGSGIVGIGGDGEELRITCTTPTTSMIVQVDYYTIES